MKILALDIGKYKTVACEYEAETGRHSFASVATTPKALHDLLVDRTPDRVVIENLLGGRHILSSRFDFGFCRRIHFEIQEITIKRMLLSVAFNELLDCV